MAGDIHQISQMLGRIEASMDHIIKITTESSGKIDTLTKTSILQEQSLKTAHERIDVVEPHVQDFVNLKNKSLGVMGVISLIFTGIGFLLSKLF